MTKKVGTYLEEKQLLPPFQPEGYNYTVARHEDYNHTLARHKTQNINVLLERSETVEQFDGGG